MRYIPLLKRYDEVQLEYIKVRNVILLLMSEMGYFPSYMTQNPKCLHIYWKLVQNYFLIIFIYLFVSLFILFIVFISLFIYLYASLKMEYNFIDP